MDRAVFVYTTFRGLVEVEAVARVISGKSWRLASTILPGRPSRH